MTDDKSNVLSVLKIMTDDKSDVLSVLGIMADNKSNVSSVLKIMTDDKSNGVLAPLRPPSRTYRKMKHGRADANT